MGKQQVNTGKGSQTVNTNNVWDRIVALESNGVPNLSGELNGVKSQLAEKAKQTDLTETNNTVALKADKTYVDQQIGNIGNASPKGAYATLTALQTAFPTGTTGVYVVSADGGWYFWSGSAWTKGGTYQSTGIPDGAITDIKMAFPAIQGKPRINLFNKDAITKDFYVDRGTGNLLAASGYNTTDYITISPSANYICNMTDGGEQLAFYDSNKVYISGLLKPATYFTTPANAMYVRLTIKTPNIAGFMFVKDTVLPGTYQAFIKPTTLNFDDSLQELESALFNSGLNENFKRDYGNLFNKSAAVTGYYVERANGNVLANASYSVTDFIKISPSTAYVTNMNNSGEQLAFYDSAKNYISGLLTPTSFTSPSNAVYMKVSVYNTNINKFMVIKGTVLPTSYVPYYSLVLKNVLIDSLASSNGKTTITVAKSGGDFNTIQSAIDNAQDSIDNPVTILIYPGTYVEAPYIGPSRFISLVGLNKATTIIQDNSGDHATGGLRFEGNGLCKNITIIQTGSSLTDSQRSTSFAYALHIDNVSGLGGNQYYEDCIFRSATSAAVGIGLQQNQEIKFKNCEFHSTDSVGSNNDGAFVVHSSNRASGVTGQKITIDSCYFYSISTYALAVEDFGSGAQEMSVTLINNTLYSTVSGTTSAAIKKTPITTGNFSGVINLTPYSHGNNIAILNVS